MHVHNKTHSLVKIEGSLTSPSAICVCVSSMGLNDGGAGVNSWDTGSKYGKTMTKKIGYRELWLVEIF